ncbi:LOW QUALITY PROTEIN: ninein-like [Thalassophryne amazonica]|uniref:LOW QUALITY PROTEIN: ninein-like n=1 Tax=Thalassophryne amazonica TaxID=390379 RepID=UPI0014716D48|nr:LOW QUALITY PROTEIN: ninein-like [Thalassophryne amazonica]
MEDADHSYYVAQLKAEFDSCDTTATGFLDRQELTALCRKLQLDAHLPLLLDTLLSERPYARVNFEQFKDGFVAVLSRSLDISTSEDDSRYLEPAVPEEVKPKFVKGTKRYGRRSHPDNMPEDLLTCDPEKSLPSKTKTTDLSPAGVRRAKLRRSTSLESVESLKSDEDIGRQRDNVQPQDAEQQVTAESHRVKEEHGEPSISERGGLLEAVCDHLGLQPLNALELDVLLQKLNADLDGRVSLKDFQMALCSSTPKRPADLQRAMLRAESGESSSCSTAPSLLTATVGCRILSRLDDGSGCTSPEQVVALWMEEGIRNSRDILQTLDFPPEERLSLADLTLALDNELLGSGNSIHQAALVSYKNEIEYLQVVAEQACRERNKVKSDLDLADQRNLQLVREVDDHHASMETLNKNRIRDLEQEYRDRLAALRSQLDQDSEVLLQQVDREHGVLQEELQLLQTRNEDLQEDVYRTTQENTRLEEELNVVKLKLSEAESTVTRLHRDLDQLLHNKFGSLDPSGAGLSYEERISEIVREYELQCRELRDRNDELSSELTFLKSHTSAKKSRRSAGDEAALSWTERHSSVAESDSDDTDLKRGSSPLLHSKLQPDNKMAQRTVDSVSGPAVSIQTELALEQLKQKHSEELQQLHIQLDTQVNYYERSLEVMRQSMEVERKDISQAFKMEISELEEQKAQAEQQAKQLKEALDKLHVQSAGGAGGWTPEQQRRMQRERAELEQNFAREISNLVQRLSAEKDQLEAELKLKMDQEVMLVREEAEQQRSQIKHHYVERQHQLLYQLQRECQQTQEQRGLWENRMVRLEQERLWWEQQAREEQARFCTLFASEKRRLQESHEQETQQLKDQVTGLQEQVTSAQDLIQNLHLQIIHLGDSLEEFRARCQQFKGFCCELKVKVQEVCRRLQESIRFLDSNSVLHKCFTSEEQLLVQLSQLKEELEEVWTGLDSFLQDNKLVAENCNQLSVFIQHQVQLGAKDQTVTTLSSEVEDLQKLLRTKVDGFSILTAEQDSLKTYDAQLLQVLKDHTMAVSGLQLEVNDTFPELDRRRNIEESLQEALKLEQSKTAELQSSLDEKEEVLGHLIQENQNYVRLTDQLSVQIVEMEEEVSLLRDHARVLSSQLNGTADPSSDIMKQVDSRSSEVDQSEYVQRQTMQLGAKVGELNPLREEATGPSVLLELALTDSRAHLRTAQEDFDSEKKKMVEQLMELEKMVLVLEEVMDSTSPHRTQLEEVQSENCALKERLIILQQEIQNLEDDMAKKMSRLEETEREHKNGREEEERLRKENSRYREEFLDLSSRNLQLSNDNAELSASLRDGQESFRTLQERLTLLSKEQEEGGATVRRLQDAATEQDRARLHQQTAWQQEHHLLERELNSYKEKMEGVAKLKAELSSVTLKQQRLEEDKAKLLKEVDAQNHKVEQMEAKIKKLIQDKEDLRLNLDEEIQKLRFQNQDLQHKMSELQVQSLEVQRLTQEQQNLKTKLNHLEMSQMQAQDQAVRADVALSLAQAQHVRQVQRLRDHAGTAEREHVDLLQARLAEEQRRSQQLEDTLKVHISMKQDQYEKAMSALQQRMEDLESKLKMTRLLLQDKVQQLKDQLVKNNKLSALTKDLYVENSQLLSALQVTEQRQKNAEKKNLTLEDKISALHRLLRETVSTSLAT